MKTLDTDKDFIDIVEIIEVIEDGTADNIEELKGIIEEIGEDSDALIRESYFGEYVFELINEIDDVSDRLKGYIDYDRIERDMRMDYYEVEIGGVIYLTLA